MAYSKADLVAKIHEMHPDIQRHGFDLVVGFDAGRDGWHVTLTHGEHTLETFLDRGEVNECLEEGRGVHLGLHIAEFLENFEHQEATAPSV